MIKTLHLTNSFGDLLELFKKTKLKYYYVCSDDGRLLGMISQSDIISALVSSDKLDLSLSEILNPNFIYWLRDVSPDPPINDLIRERVTECPILDSNFRILGTYSLFDHA